MLFVCYPKCTTCQKAQKYLAERGVAVTVRDIKQDPPTAEELRLWQAGSGLPLRRFLNTSGMLYRRMNLRDRVPEMSDDELIALLASDGMLVKRPILVGGGMVLVGFRQPEWEEKLP